MGLQKRFPNLPVQRSWKPIALPELCDSFQQVVQFLAAEVMLEKCDSNKVHDFRAWEKRHARRVSKHIYAL